MPTSARKNTTNRLARALGASALGLLALGTATAAWGMSELRRFRVHHYTLPLLEKGTLRGREDFTILHVSDLHMIPGQARKIEFVNSLSQLRPDLVVNTGDNLSDPRAVPDVLRALDPLLPLPGLFIFGTNDYWAPSLPNPFNYLLGKKNTPSYVELPWRGMRAAFIEHGWMDATHQRHEFQVSSVRIAAAGVDDPHHDLDDFATIAGPPNKDADLSLALLHAPEPRVLQQFADAGYHLSLSGHTHGGQLCLPGGKAIVTNCGIDKERAFGVHDFSGMAMSVSNGLGTSKFVPFRFFCRPSATVLHITERD